MVEMTYVKQETLLELALGVYECKGSVYECKGLVYECYSEVNEVFGKYLYQKDSDERENSYPSSNKISSRWIRIMPQNVRNMEPQKFNEGASWMPKRRKRALDS